MRHKEKWITKLKDLLTGQYIKMTKVKKTKQVAIVNKHAMPTLQELYDDKIEIVKQSKLNLILNSEPKADWIKSHPFVKNLKYLPIERVEYLLTMIFSKWNVEVKEVKLLANSVVTTVRLYVQNPITGEMDYQDGIGAMPIQVQKGSGATEFDKMNSSAVQIGAPASESFAIKDAAEKFGRIFGKDLNRKDTIAYSDRLHASIDTMQKMSIIEQFEKTSSKEEVRKLWLELSQKERDDSDIKLAYEVAMQKVTPTKNVIKS